MSAVRGQDGRGPGEIMARAGPEPARQARLPGDPGMSWLVIVCGGGRAGPILDR